MHLQRSHVIACLLAALFFGSGPWTIQLIASPASAETPTSSPSGAVTYPIVQAAEPIELSYLPEEAVLAVLVQPARVLSSPEFEPAPVEVLQAMGLEQFGIDALDVAQVLVAVKIIEYEYEYDGETYTDSAPVPLAVVRLTQPYSLEDSLAAAQPGWEQDELNGGLLPAGRRQR